MEAKEIKVSCEMMTGDYVSASKLDKHNHRLFITNHTDDGDSLADIAITPEKAIKFAEELIDMSNQMIHDRDNFKAEIEGLDNGDDNEPDIGKIQVRKNISLDYVELYINDLYGRSNIVLNEDRIDALIDALNKAKNFGGN